ncbi:MAG TPA: hypothetical protein EYH49_05085 [Aquifex aeolicus]|nr:hypothetical protein [Aquifex aeolicus]
MLKALLVLLLALAWIDEHLAQRVICIHIDDRAAHLESDELFKGVQEIHLDPDSEALKSKKAVPLHRLTLCPPSSFHLFSSLRVHASLFEKRPSINSHLRTVRLLI